MHCTALVVAARSNLNHLETQRHCCMRRAQGVSKPNDARPLVRKPSPPWKIFHLAYFCLAGVTRLCGCCMVFYFEPRGFGPGRNDNLVYVGKDKFENEDLITHGLPTDIWQAAPRCHLLLHPAAAHTASVLHGAPTNPDLMTCRFHVDDLSSAHVYLRLPPGQAFEAVPADTLEDCAQLVKANSIVGSKRSTVDVVYTPWSNLKKTAAMDVGQVGLAAQMCGCKHTVQQYIRRALHQGVLVCACFTAASALQQLNHYLQKLQAAVSLLLSKVSHPYILL